LIYASKPITLLIGEHMPNLLECITDFNCLETVAKLAPIGTALIASGGDSVARNLGSDAHC